MDSVIFNKALLAGANGDIDYNADTFGVILVSGYTPDKDAHEFRDDVDAFEIAATGYVAGGETVTVAATLDLDNDRLNVSLGGKVWTPASIAAKGAVYFKKRGGPSSADELICYIDFGGEVVSTNDDWTLLSSMIRLQN